MSISLQSEAVTVLLWGDRWWLPGRSAPVAFAPSDAAADALVAAVSGDAARRLRLIYQPDGFVSVSTPCPHAGRRTLALALQEQFPGLATDDVAWSHEPILPLGDSFTTILHYEAEPRLFALVAELETRGFTVESVWPLGTFLHALQDEWSESGATTVLAIESERACAYRHGADGQRVILPWRREQTTAEVGRWLAAILTQEPNEPVLIVAEADEVAALDAHVALADQPGVTLVSFREALGRRVVLPRHHTAQLLPPAPVITTQRAVIAASLAFLAVAGWSGASYARDALAWRTEGETREVQKIALRTEVFRLRANAAEITMLRAALADVSVNPPCGEFLEKLSTTLPPEIALAKLRVSGGRFTLQGHVAPGASAGVLETWRIRFADSRWTLESQAAPAPSGAFVVEGKFTS